MVRWIGLLALAKFVAQEWPTIEEPFCDWRSRCRGLGFQKDTIVDGAGGRRDCWSVRTARGVEWNTSVKNKGRRLGNRDEGARGILDQGRWSKRLGCPGCMECGVGRDGRHVINGVLTRTVNNGEWRVMRVRGVGVSGRDNDDRLPSNLLDFDVVEG